MNAPAQMSEAEVEIRELRLAAGAHDRRAELAKKKAALAKVQFKKVRKATRHAKKAAKLAAKGASDARSALERALKRLSKAKKKSSKGESKTDAKAAGPVKNGKAKRSKRKSRTSGKRPKATGAGPEIIRQEPAVAAAPVEAAMPS